MTIHGSVSWAWNQPVLRSGASPDEGSARSPPCCDPLVSLQGLVPASSVTRSQGASAHPAALPSPTAPSRRTSCTVPLVSGHRDLILCTSASPGNHAELVPPQGRGSSLFDSCPLIAGFGSGFSAAWMSQDSLHFSRMCNCVSGTHGSEAPDPFVGGGLFLWRQMSGCKGRQEPVSDPLTRTPLGFGGSGQFGSLKGLRHMWAARSPGQRSDSKVTDAVICQTVVLAGGGSGACWLRAGSWRRPSGFVSSAVPLPSWVTLDTWTGLSPVFQIFIWNPGVRITYSVTPLQAFKEVLGNPVTACDTEWERWQDADVPRWLDSSKLLIHPLRAVLLPALPSPFYRGAGKGTERLRDTAEGAQQSFGRAGFRLGELGPESTCLAAGLTVLWGRGSICVAVAT